MDVGPDRLNLFSAWAVVAGDEGVGGVGVYTVLILGGTVP